jgi:hypothetical protein
MRATKWIESTFHVSEGGALNTQSRKKHWCAAFGSIDQHLNCQPPFGRLSFCFGKPLDVIRGIAERSRWRAAG